VVVKREIVIQIAADGSIALEVKGVAGPDCVEFTKALEEALGEVIQRERTPDFYQQTPRGEITTRQGE
jgi:hypothetical protein